MIFQVADGLSVRKQDIVLQRCSEARTRKIGLNMEGNRFGLDIRKKMSNDKIWLRMEPTVFK